MNEFLVRREIGADILPADPVAWCHAFKDRPGTVLLDSALSHDGLGQWSFLAIDPVHLLRSKAGRTWLDDRVIESDPFTTIPGLLDRYRIRDHPELPPFATGIAGYFGYDLRRHVERVPEHDTDDLRMPDLMLGVYDLALAVDHRDKRAWLMANARSANSPGARIEWAMARLSAARDYRATGTWEINARPDLSRTRVEAMVRRAIEYIEAGDIYQANITQRFSALLPPGFDRLALYSALRLRNPATFAAYLDFGMSAVLSSSPERFLRLRAGLVETRPIKGTRPRGRDACEDSQLARQLLASEKDRAENLMIVDLLRNDLSRVCRVGSVRVPVLCGLESYATVHHLVSVVTGELRSECDAVDLLRAAFPGGSVTGAPKIRAMEIIAELEPTWRGPYCGAIGYLSATGAMDTSIVIRAYCIERDRLTLQVGGGIVADSDPGAEYEESLLKARALIEVLGQSDPALGQAGHAA